MLALLWEEWQQWFKDFSSEPPKRNDLESFIQQFAGSIAQRKLLCGLTSILASVLEKNMSEETVRDFKNGSLKFFELIAEHFFKRCPDLDKTAHMQLLHDTVSLITGLYPLTHPSPVVARVLHAPELKFFKRNFSEELERLLLAGANDLRNKAKARSKNSIVFSK